MNRPEGFSLEFQAPGGPACDGRWRPAPAPREHPVLLAHGAGAGHELPLLAALERCLSARRFDVLSFHYPYMTRMHREGRRRPPDRTAVLEEAHEQALALLSELCPGRRAILAGKSMGGRIASHIAARGAAAAGLVLVGYPLSPAGKPEVLRAEHFRALVQPALFLSGTRDALCDLPRLRRALETYGGQAELEVIEGADHDFNCPKRAGDLKKPTAESMAEDLAARIEAWVERQWPD
ncbi:MAG: dienelactone hydrolase family protein [Planctomycetes bacterium]|nr:dienelactone hydrolase family protein [Planctomycetota bacterium]